MLSVHLLNKQTRTLLTFKFEISSLILLIGRSNLVLNIVSKYPPGKECLIILTIMRNFYLTDHVMSKNIYPFCLIFNYVMVDCSEGVSYMNVVEPHFRACVLVC